MGPFVRTIHAFIYLTGLFAAETSLSPCVRIVSRAQIELVSLDGKNLEIGSEIRVLNEHGRIILGRSRFLGLQGAEGSANWSILALDPGTGTIHKIPALGALLPRADGVKLGREYLNPTPPLVLHPFYSSVNDTCLAVAVLHALVSLKAQGAKVPLLDGRGPVINAAYDALIERFHRGARVSGVSQQVELGHFLKEQGIAYQETRSHSRGEFRPGNIEKLRAHLKSGGITLTTYFGSFQSNRHSEADHSLGKQETHDLTTLEPDPKGENHVIFARGLFSQEGKDSVLIFEPSAGRYLVRPFEWLAFGNDQTASSFGSSHWLLSPELSF